MKTYFFILILPLMGAINTVCLASVELTKKSNYYDVILNYDDGDTPFEIGRKLGEKIMTAVPQYESIVDSFLSERFMGLPYGVIRGAVNTLRQNLPRDIKNEIEGMALAFSGTEEKFGDGKLSLGEVYFMNLFADVRPMACSALGVKGSWTKSGAPKTLRLLDWKDGKGQQLTRTHGVKRFIKNGKTVVTIGTLGYLGAMTAINSHGVFAGLLDAGSLSRFRPKDKESYPFALRRTMETAQSILDVSDYMTDHNRRYTYNHLIYVADNQNVGVVENNFSGWGRDMKRALRTPESRIHDRIKWPFPNSIVTVNSFLLWGNHYNHYYRENHSRFDSFKTLMDQFQKEGRYPNLKGIATSNKGEAPGSIFKGDIFNTYSNQVILYSARDKYLEVWFRPTTQSGKIEGKPIFTKVFL